MRRLRFYVFVGYVDPVFMRLKRTTIWIPITRRCWHPFFTFSGLNWNQFILTHTWSTFNVNWMKSLITIRRLPKNHKGTLYGLNKFYGTVRALILIWYYLQKLQIKNSPPFRVYPLILPTKRLWTHRDHKSNLQTNNCKYWLPCFKLFWNVYDHSCWRLNPFEPNYGATKTRIL